MSSCNRSQALSREAYEKMKRDTYDAYLDAEYERKPAFVNAPESDAKENMAAGSFARTCGSCKHFGADPDMATQRYCGKIERHIYSNMPVRVGCGCYGDHYQPRTDSLEQVARDMYEFIVLCRDLGAKVNKDGGKLFKQRLRDCGIEVE